jgi:sRNA-binding carbon storage regulator CsrA
VRREQQGITIKTPVGDIHLIPSHIRRGRVRLAFEGPPEVRIVRDELLGVPMPRRLTTGR